VVLLKAVEQAAPVASAATGSVCRSLAVAAFLAASHQESFGPKQQAAPQLCPAHQASAQSCAAQQVSPAARPEQQLWSEPQLARARQVSPAAQQEQAPASQQARRPQEAQQSRQQEEVQLAAPQPEPPARAPQRQAQLPRQAAPEVRADACARLWRPHRSRPYRRWL
jgi:hypothetical protein